MAKRILNFAFHILQISYPCCWLVIPLIVSYWLARQAPMCIHNGSGRIYCLLSASRWRLGGLLCVLMMWWVNLLSTIRLMVQKIRFLNVLTHLLSTFMAEVANLKECGIERSKTSKACKK